MIEAVISNPFSILVISAMCLEIWLIVCGLKISKIPIWKDNYKHGSNRGTNRKIHLIKQRSNE